MRAVTTTSRNNADDINLQRTQRDFEGLDWRTSSRSSGGACVKVAVDGNHVHVRDSKDRSGPVLTFDRETFQAFVDFVCESGDGAAN
ncbi:DUF397 domain-containing protein [Actinoplanes sp. NPDC049599]|uniref:DUF397 domain-containing protein n=1 Tax=Actinoplanes sp. NPDC049599 TaxID=3363903 RepID=UPI0037B97E1E